MMKTFLVILFLIPFLSKAEEFSMRKCMILPISDALGNSFSFKVYENLEREIKNKKWCQYVSSSEVIEIFSKYRDKLPDHLEDPNVLATVAKRLKVGTIIKVGLSFDVDKLHLSMNVIGENGSDLYFSEKTTLTKIDAYEVNLTLKNWLELYETLIPYDGRVSGVLGDQITFTFSKNKRVGVGQEFKIKKLLKKKKHPLLKKIVEWESAFIAKGRVFNLSRGQALGVVKTYMSEKKVQVGDWIRLEKYDPRKVYSDKKLEKYERNRFGRLGDFSLSMEVSSHTVRTTAGTGNNKLGGIGYGVSAEIETWVTRQYFVLGEFSKKIANLSKISGSPSLSTSGQRLGTLKVGGGLKYLPLGFFYGPQVNFYTGWVKYSYELDSSSSDGFGVNTVSGIFLGVGGNIPIKKGVRMIGSAEIIPFANFSDEDNFYSSSKSLSSMVFKVGAQYQWSPAMKLFGTFNVVNNSVRFNGKNSKLSYADTSVKCGGVFSF